MAKTTVKDLAADLNLPVETLLSQLKEAGLSQSCLLYTSPSPRDRG